LFLPLLSREVPLHPRLILFRSFFLYSILVLLF
jgi:hypothetical protein